ncbi:cell division inhibitor SulA [Leminorella grimontii]|uniref:cell division inhibitor SulA n=1 Tax=Leminorella grimontii TaxID=82981 RepID=UPI00321F9CD5
MYIAPLITNNASHTLFSGLSNSRTGMTTNLVSEIVYDPQNPFTLHLLLPFLQQLGQQPRWQLWLSSERRLNRHWISRLGLSEKKSISLRTSSTQESVLMLEKALRSGNFSSVIAWLPELTQQDKESLNQAAAEGDCYCFVLQPMMIYRNNAPQGSLNGQWH